MSRQEFHIGKITPIKDSKDKTPQQIAEMLNVYVEYYSEDDWSAKSFMAYKGIYYKIEDTEFKECEYLKEYDMNSDGSINYVSNFYNGGTCLSQELEEIIESSF